MTFTFVWQWKLQSSARQLWPLISDADRVDALAGLPPVRIKDDASVQPPAHLLSMRIFGQTIEWEELPFEWVSPQWFKLMRKYRRGPIARMVVTYRLDELETGGSQISCTILAEPANLLGYLIIPILIGLMNRRRFERAFRTLDNLALKENIPHTRIPIPAPIRVRDGPLIETYARRLIELGFDEILVNRLTMLVRDAPDSEVAHMHPILWARRWGADENEVVRLFLTASRLGLLELQWNISCPACHGMPVSATQLNNLEERAYCPFCRIAYEADFEHAVQVTFRPHPVLREIITPTYCVGGPGNTPHIITQLWLDPGEARTVELDLHDGLYRLRWQTHPDWRETVHSFEEWRASRPWQALLIVRDGATKARFQLGGSLYPSSVHLSPGRVSLMIVNNESRPHLVSIESTYLADYILTAARVSTMQSFRDLFPSEALRKGLHIRLSSITILFTDLCGSTAFYRRVGDGPAFDRVTAHFDILRNNVASAGGAIVKTIGDAIMGVFPTPETGLQAVKGILREIEAYNAKHGDWPLRLRLGLNSGPALVVTLNEKLDYFGSTVNLASKLERQSRSNEVILPQSVFNLLTVSRDEWEIEPAEVTVPGEDGPLAVVRLRLQSRS